MPQQRYDLSPQDRRKLAETIRRVMGGRVSSRPTPTRRVPRSSGGGSGRLVWAMVIDAIPAATLTGSPTYACTCGNQPASVVLLNVDEDGNLAPDDEPLILEGLWRGKKEFRASDGEPIVVVGQRVGADKFLIAGGTDTRELTGFVLANPQSIGHDADDYPEWQDDIECEEP